MKAADRIILTDRLFKLEMALCTTHRYDHVRLMGLIARLEQRLA